MKNKNNLHQTLKLALLAIILTSSCSSYAFDKTIKGNGNVITENRHASSFYSIKATEGIEVIISAGEVEAIKVEADENIIQYITTEIRDGKLKIYVDNDVQLRSCEKKVYVQYKQLNKIKVSSGAILKSIAALNVNQLELSASSGGIMKLEIFCGNLKANVSSGGVMKLRGKAKDLNLSGSSGGILKASDLNGKNCYVKVSSGGILNIGIIESLSANASSGGIFKYHGDPINKDIRKSSGGIISSKSN